MIIIKHTRNVAEGASVTRLARHLMSDENERVAVVSGDLKMMKTFRDIAKISGHKYALNHWTINPDQEISRDQLFEIVGNISKEYGFEEFILIEHLKEREDGSKNPHFHLVAESTKDGVVLDVSNSYLRNEFLSRTSEILCGMELGSGSHNTYTKARLEEVGLGGETPMGDSVRGSQTYSTRQHQKAKRIGINLPQVAYEISQVGGGDTSHYYQSLLEIADKHKITFEKGTKRNVIIIKNDSGDAGSVNKILGISRKETDDFFEQLEQAKQKLSSDIAEEHEDRIQERIEPTKAADSEAERADTEVVDATRTGTDGDPAGGIADRRNVAVDLQQPNSIGQQNDAHREPSNRVIGVAQFVQGLKDLLKNAAMNRGVNKSSGYAPALRNIANSESPEYPIIDKKNAWSFLRRWSANYAKGRQFTR